MIEHDLNMNAEVVRLNFTFATEKIAIIIFANNFFTDVARFI